jgi:membrane protease YdiL (CAAX protease family)
MEGDSSGPGAQHQGQDKLCCYRHPSAPASSLCVSCARPICRDCEHRVGYLHYCPECFALVTPPTMPRPTPEPADERERRWWRADWSLKEVTLAMLLIFGIYYAFSLLFFLLIDDSFLSGNICYVAIFCPLIALGAWFILRRHGRGFKELGFQLKRPGRAALFSGLGGLSALAFSYGTYFIIVIFFYIMAGRTPVSGESEKVQSVGGAALAFFIIVTVVLAPVFEELLFRGLFYPPLRRRFGPGKAILLDGMIFGALHFEPLFMLSLILVGMVLAYLYEKTDSLFVPILTHAFYNMMVIAITFIVG